MQSEFDNFQEMLEGLGEPEVTKRISQGVWADRRKDWADAWLVQMASTRQEAARFEDSEVAKSAKEAAWVAARASSDAAASARIQAESAMVTAREVRTNRMIAKAALAISAITAIVTIIGLFRH